MVRMAAFAAVALVFLIAAFELMGGGFLNSSPRPTVGPTPGVTQRVTPAAPTARSSGTLAPLGFRGSGVVAFTRQDATGHDDVYRIDPSGSNERLVVPGGCCVLISPNGKLLAAAVPGGGLVQSGTGLLGINTYTQPGNTPATTIPAQCGACAISVVNSAPDAWSLDGSQVAIDTWNDADPTRDGMAIAGNPPSWIYGTGALGPKEPPHRDLPIAFSPDGTQLLFMRDERDVGPSSYGPLFLLSIGLRVARQLTPTGMTLITNGLAQGPASWSPDGRTIAFAASDSSSGTSHTGIFSVGLEAHAPIQTIVADAPGATSARFSPDGMWIAYDVAAAGGFHDLHLVHPDGTGDRNMTSTFDPGVCCGVWSPDGTALLVPGTNSDDSHYDLFIASLAGDIYQLTQHQGIYSGIVWGSSPQ